MLGRWWRRHRDARTLARRPIPDALWQLTLARFPFLAARTADDRQRLRELSTLFLADKEFAGMQGLQVDDGMAVAIAAQACLPVLHLGLHQYDAFKGIVVHPDVVVARREVMDEDGVVHHYDEELSGEAMEGGPVMLSWRDVADAGDSAAWGYNVVVHEFAHVLDRADGAFDGTPELRASEHYRPWGEVLGQRYLELKATAERKRTLLRSYGATNEAEFFAVATESFFEKPRQMRERAADLYAELSRFYGCDPAAAEAVESAPAVEIGRNDRCPCGSGRKYKRCCGRDR